MVSLHVQVSFQLYLPEAYLTNDEEIFPFHGTLFDLLLNCVANLTFIPVQVCTVNMAVPKVNGKLDDLFHFSWRCLEAKGGRQLSYNLTLTVSGNLFYFYFFTIAKLGAERMKLLYTD